MVWCGQLYGDKFGAAGGVLCAVGRLDLGGLNGVDLEGCFGFGWHVTQFGVSESG